MTVMGIHDINVQGGEVQTRVYMASAARDTQEHRFDSPSDRLAFSQDIPAASADQPGLGKGRQVHRGAKPHGAPARLSSRIAFQAIGAVNCRR